MDKRLFSVLGLETSASVTEVRAAYRRLARRHHPDIAGPSSAAKFAEISRAHETLIKNLEAGWKPGSAPPSYPCTARPAAPCFDQAGLGGYAKPPRRPSGDLVDDTVSDILEDIDGAFVSFTEMLGNLGRKSSARR